MFYKNQTIHIPDSPRNQNTEAWLAGKTIRTKHRHVEGGRPFKNIDVMKLNDQIAHGFLKAEWNERNNHLNFVFKHAAGVYRQYGFNGGYIDVPLPDIYVAVRMGVTRDGSNYSVYTRDVHIGTRYPQLLPLSNLFGNRDRNVSESVQEENGDDVLYTHVCDGGVLSRYVGQVQHIIDILNKCASHMTAFLLSNGNLDLSLPDNRRKSYTTAHSISSYISDSNRASRYINYWVFLNMLLADRTPEQIYEELSQCDRSSDVFNHFGLTSDDVKSARSRYQRGPNKLEM